MAKKEIKHDNPMDALTFKSPEAFKNTIFYIKIKFNFFTIKKLKLTNQYSLRNNHKKEENYYESDICNDYFYDDEYYEAYHKINNPSYEPQQQQSPPQSSQQQSQSQAQAQQQSQAQAQQKQQKSPQSSQPQPKPTSSIPDYKKLFRAMDEYEKLQQQEPEPELESQHQHQHQHHQQHNQQNHQQQQQSKPQTQQQSTPNVNSHIIDGQGQYCEPMDINSAVEDYAALTRLYDRLDLYNLENSRDIPGDGNCQMHALSDQVFGDLNHGPEIRRAIVAWLRDNKNFTLNNGAKLSQFANTNDWNSYCNRMSRNGTWGDHLTLLAASELLKSQITIISSVESERSSIIEIIPSSIQNSREILLSHYAKHYGSLRSKP
ncbi:hypothetical protein DICPUDRAFT_84282 [Dictyostelium purpureum]|uniref:OTU domain-containing protein n=1 Tax=Dictyostelium purpureum TaxID=5786 RepID=F1A258_DICPU|nr:uncharacterized protein DICPUDRAFT_84282 [Dictyostelium purpureum]EGC29728.1 hypothetical protein DICPUDRAFT_84282 [Dictyostelium purpureum]|eukprot:XP_003293754.1 hypothetical protein DICPUDRAFT_84282 [Dictyostelium purpureum]